MDGENEKNPKYVNVKELICQKCPGYGEAPFYDRLGNYDEHCSQCQWKEGALVSLAYIRGESEVPYP